MTRLNRIPTTLLRPGMRSVLAAGVIGAAGLVSSAPAQAVTYSGTLTGVPGSEIILIFEREDGLLYLDQFGWGQAPWACDNGTESIGLSGGYHPPDGLVSQRRFRIHRVAPENDYVGLLSGQFNRNRTKLSGELRYRAQHHDPTYGVCDTGKLEWRAAREV